MLDSHAGVVEQADTRDLKSLAVKSVPVRSRSAAPNIQRRHLPPLICFQNLSESTKIPNLYKGHKNYSQIAGRVRKACAG